MLKLPGTKKKGPRKVAWQIYFRALLNSSRNPSSASIAARRRSSGGIVRSCDLVGRPGNATRSCITRISRSLIAGVFQEWPAFRPHGNFFPSAFICAIHRRRPSDRAASTRALPSGVLAPVDKPPCRRQRFLPLTGQRLHYFCFGNTGSSGSAKARTRTFPRSI